MKNIKYTIIVFGFFLIYSNVAVSQYCVGTAGELDWDCWFGLFDDEMGELTAQEYYPNKPSVTQKVYRLETPTNYNNYLGSRIAGFISVPQTGYVQFNVTGDDKVEFKLSSDTTSTNLSLIAFVPSHTSKDGHNQYVEQTSDSLMLVAGEYYYFELTHVEGGGGDHATVYWRNDFVDPVEWNIITAGFLNNIGCRPADCPIRGTPCDDGNSNTIDDQEDGHCNCYGNLISSNGCIGNQNQITTYQYEGIAGDELNDLYMDPNFPGNPATSIQMDQLGSPYENRFDSIGRMVQGYIRVPVSGNYKFNITSNNEGIFFLSSDDNEANKQTHQILVSGWTYTVEHDKYIYQTTANINLDANQYYFFEINMKESGGSEHFNIYWQTPFTQTNVWKRIPGIYTYDYECSLACIPQGAPCDDGDPFTNDDVYDANCECVGIPCDPSTCDDPLASYIPYPKCDVTDELDNRADNNWLSCTQSPNPNPMRAVSHWIQYDLGSPYKLFNSHVWNYNENNTYNQGFEMVAVDFSEDGVNWTELGVYNWSLADGSSNYGGFIGPDFNGFTARYVLFTCLDNNTACKGLGKVAFSAFDCSVEGIACDDGDPMTVNDRYDANCNCSGTPLDENQCEIDTLLLGDTLIYTNNYSAIDFVESKNVLDTSATISLIGGEEISLGIGFDAPINTDLNVLIDTCDIGNISTATEGPMTQEENLNSVTKNLIVTEVDSSGLFIIQYKLTQPQDIILELVDLNGNVLYNLVNQDHKNKGIYFKRFRATKLDPGNYGIRLTSTYLYEFERLVVL